MSPCQLRPTSWANETALLNCITICNQPPYSFAACLASSQLNIMDIWQQILGTVPFVLSIYIFIHLSCCAGDVAVYGTPRATIIIRPNDDASGIFRFADPLTRGANEGSTVQFEYVPVYWDTYIDKRSGFLLKEK